MAIAGRPDSGHWIDCCESESDGGENIQIDDLSLLVLHFGGFGVEVLTGDGEVGGGGFFGPHKLGLK